eukprot:scaffold41537_cov206-Amphora_coffeaeformis.AAC.4
MKWAIGVLRLNYFDSHFPRTAIGSRMKWHFFLEGSDDSNRVPCGLPGLETLPSVNIVTVPHALGRQARTILQDSIAFIRQSVCTKQAAVSCERVSA